ncbi:hypothetical protein XM25_01680 [Devosia sp. H5989]|nr:hypothetical protein XM25_01680 [Devosia sp. H5989]
MALPTKPVLVGMTLGATAATALAMTGAGSDIRAFADEMLAPSFDKSKLAIFDDSLFTIDTEPNVSLEATHTAVVRKIEFGRTSFVKIMTTPSGTYSTDGLASPHVRYPGIHVTPLTGAGVPVTSVAFWSDKSGWTVAPLLSAGSIFALGN